MSLGSADPLPDILAERLAVVFCGINPGLAAAATAHHFHGRSKRFWRVLHRAGFTPEEISPENGRAILQHRCGLTTLVERPRHTASTRPCWRNVSIRVWPIVAASAPALSRKCVSRS